MSGRQLHMLQVANQPGPFYCFLRPLIFELMRRGIDVDVACSHTDLLFDKLSAAGMHLVPLTVGSWSRPATWLTLRRELPALFARKKYDICVVHTPAISWITRREATRAAVPVVAHMTHGLPFFERQDWLVYRTLLAVEKHCARYTDLLITINADDTREAQRQQLVKPGGLVRQVPGSGLDVDRWSAPPPEKLEDLRRRFSLAPSARVLFYAGRLMASKGVLDLIEVLTSLARQGRDVHLIVAGTGELAEAMRRRALQRGVQPRLHLLGWRDDIVSLMHLADLLLLPSTYREGLPTVLIEAGAAGKPVIAYRNRGSNDIVFDGRTGFLVPADDLDALTSRVAQLLDDPALARAMGEAGRRHVAATFSYAQGVGAQLEAYAAALEAKGLDAAVLRGPLGPPVFSLATGQGGGP
jgi:glycosyltransferase involved in cell wall biosynthesis